VVSIAFGSAKVTVPGPETFDQVVVTAPGGLGRPSSVTVPSSVALAGRVIVWSGPALTFGAWFAPLTVMTTSSLVVSAESLAVRRSV
jgi:hypothetical protein